MPALIPDGLRYTAEHEWVAPGAGAVRVGITDFAQDALGDIVYVQLPEPGSAVQAGQSLGEVESTKSVSEIYAPVSGKVATRNERLGEEPELINTDPYGDGRLVENEPESATAIDDLLDAEGYRRLTEG